MYLLQLTVESRFLDLRKLKAVSSTPVLMVRYNHSLPLDAKIMYQKTAQSLVNKLLSFSGHNRLPKQQYDLLKPHLIAALETYGSKTARLLFFYFIKFW